MRTLVCCHCGKQVSRNKKLKHLIQHYCGAKVCQSARKRSYEREKYKKDPVYRLEKLRRARDRKKAHADRGDPQACSRYQSNYRASHPDYVTENRKKQRLRNALKADKRMPETKIVNPDTYMMQKPVNDTVYAMIEVDYKNIVNPVTFMSQIAGIELVTKFQPMFVRLL